MPRNGPWPDLVSLWLEFTEGLQSPELFRLWSGIGLVAGALERRIWTQFGSGRLTFPNLYVLLVAAPGVGKQVIEDVRHIWESTTELDSKMLAFCVASDSVTAASLIDELVKAKKVITTRAEPEEFHSLLVAAEEFQLLLPGFDPHIISRLNSLWTNKELHRESRRTGLVREVTIKRPQLNILAGAQPTYLASTFPDEAWSSGLCRRLIMIYAAEGPLIDLFQDHPGKAQTRHELITRLSQLSATFGRAVWTESAMEKLRKWHLAKGPPQPTHAKLTYYSSSRSEFVIKLCMVSGLSRTGELVVDETDLNRALMWLLEAEAKMPDIFREMVGRSDRDVIDETHRFAMSLWARSAQKAVQGSLLREFLLNRVPHDKAETLLLAMERAQIMARVPGEGDLWVPRPRYGRVGVE